MASPGFLLLLSLATGFAAVAAFLWHAAAVRGRRASSMRRLVARAPVAAARQLAEEPRIAGPNRVAVLLRRLDLRPDLRSSVLVLAPGPLLALVLGLAKGWPLGLLALALAVLVGFGAYTLRREAAQRRLTHAVPVFVDGLVRSITLGQSPGAAFLASLQATEGPLRRALGQTEGLLAAGVELDVALTQTGRTYDNEALLLLGSVMRMATRYGGSIDQVLERLASFLRDRQEAEQELAAVSAETRVSSWVLGTLPVAVTLMILFTNAAYLAGMWNDDTGRQLLAGALGLELLGAFLLYRLARLR